MSITSKPRETREDRARREFTTYRMTTGNLKVRVTGQPERQVGVVFVGHGENLYTVNLCAAGNGDLKTCGCNCPDWQRRKSYEVAPSPCKHQIAAALWLTGDVPAAPVLDDEPFPWELPTIQSAQPGWDWEPTGLELTDEEPIGYREPTDAQLCGVR